MMPTTKRALHGETLESLTLLLTEHGHPAFRARQILDWLYKKRVSTWPEMTNLSVPLRQWLDETFELNPTAFVLTKQSEDVTDKLLLELAIKPSLRPSSSAPPNWASARKTRAKPSAFRPKWAAPWVANFAPRAWKA